MGLSSFLRRTGNVKSEDLPDNSGLVTASIRVEPIDRHKRKVKAVIAEQDTSETIFKMEFTDVKSNTGYFAKEKAAEILRLYCDQNKYILKDKDLSDNLDRDKQAKVEMSKKRTR